MMADFRKDRSIAHSVVIGLKSSSSILVALILIFVGPMVAQKPAVPTGADPVSAEITTIKATVRRVNVDVVVTDRNNHPVTGLTKEDFSIREDNVLQPLRTFDIHSISNESAYAVSEAPSLPPNTFINIAKTDRGTATVILFDAHSMVDADRDYGQQELFEYLKQRKQRRVHNQLAIFGFSDQLYLMQGFNEELSVPKLQKAFERLLSARHRNFSGSADQSATRTFDALAGVGRFLAQMPGRKNLIWYSAHVPHAFTLYYQSLYYNKLIENHNYTEQIRQTADLLNLSHVAVYPVDVRGVRVHSGLDAARKDFYGVITATSSTFAAVDIETRATMDALADDTGGHAFYSTNDLKEAVSSAIQNGSTYYAITYEPTNPKYDGSQRHIKVTLKKPGYNLAYRRIYFADDLSAVAHAAADAPEGPLTPALERGTPLAQGLLVEAHLDAAGPPVPATPEQMQVLSQYGAMRTMDQKASGKIPPVMMQVYAISYGLIARQLEMPADETGAHRASLEFGLIAYDDEGRKLTGTDTHVDDTIPGPRYEKVVSDGYHVVQAVAVPVTAASLRLAVHDVKGNRIGSLEVQLPLAKVSGP